MKNLPNIGTVSEAKEKMIDGYKTFLDSCAKFMAIGEFYIDKSHEGQPLPSDFASKYTLAFTSLKQASTDDIGYKLAFYTILDLEFIDEIKENLDSYSEIIKNGPDKTVSEYDQACDYLSIRDEFIDLKKELDYISMRIGKERYAETNFNDPNYDYNAKEFDNNKFNN